MAVVGGRYCGGVRTWLGILGGVVTLVAVAACSEGGGSWSDDGAAAEPVPLVGETTQGLRLRIDPVSEREVSLRLPANCDHESGEDASIPLHWHRFEAEVDSDGSFSVDETFIEDGFDGDENHVDVRIDGDLADDGTATGTLEATSRWWNGQGRAFDAPCETGTVAWTADRPPVEGDDLVVPTVDPTSLASAGTDLVASSDWELVRIDAATGDAWIVDILASAGPGPTEADPGASPTTRAGGSPATDTGDVGATAAPEAQNWLQEMAVVADGVWKFDPVTGSVARFELADGTRTATIAEPLATIAAESDALWTVSTDASRTGYALDKRDPVTGAVLASTPVEWGKIVAGRTDVWYADATLAGGRLSPVDPTTLALGEPFEVDISLVGEAPVASRDHVWWVDVGTLMSIDLTTGEVARVDLPSPTWAVAADATGVWAVHEQEAVVRRIEGDRVVRTVDLADGLGDVAVTADGSVWLAAGDAAGGEPGIVRLDPAVTAG